jgi:Icc protein
MHHPPFTTLIGHMDEIGLLEGAERARNADRPLPNVERVICGHLHRAIDVRFGGTIASTSPAPAHQVCLDLAPGARPPPGRWSHPLSGCTHGPRAAGRLVTHLAASGRFEGPFLSTTTER